MLATEQRSQDKLSAWCDDALRASHAGFELEALVDGARISIAGGANRPAVLHNCGCIQEMWLGALAHMLADTGQLDLDAKIGVYLPELNSGTEPGQNVTVANLLCHSAGLTFPPPGLFQAADISWKNFCAFLVSQAPRFPPGQVADYELTERILLLRIMTRVLSRSPYDVIRAMMPAGIDASFQSAGRCSDIGLHDLIADTRSIFELCRHLRTDSERWLNDAFLMHPNSSIEYFSTEMVAKDYVPLFLSSGLLGFGNRLWGQNGSSEHGFFGVRFDGADGNIFFGSFKSKFEREMILNEFSHRLGYSLHEGPASKRLGFLGEMDPVHLAGIYDYGSRGQLIVTYEPSNQALTFQGDGGRFRCKVQPDRTLTAPLPFPGIWIEPFAHPATGIPCFAIGQTCASRIE